jgi:hypothetical protein
MSSMPRPFLKARWEDLVLINYSCPANLLQPLVPRGTELDAWNGDTLISLVGFMFRDTRVVGLRIPFHATFQEVNLRFYVRRVGPANELRRAVVFIRELVPRVAIATVARVLYNEPYLAVPMSHRSSLNAEQGGGATYSWSYQRRSVTLSAEARGPARLAAPDSEAEFMTEHYWGYTRQRDGSTLEYRVDHPAWLVWEATSASVTGAVDSLYGPAFGQILAMAPRSAFIAVGSDVSVHRGRRLTPSG